MIIEDRVESPFDCNREREFVDCYEVFFPRILKYLRGQLPTMQDAADTAQIAFLELFQAHRNPDQNVVALGGLIFTIAHRRAIDFYKTADHKPEHYELDDDILLSEENASIDYEETQKYEFIAKSIESLPKIFSTVIYLRYYKFLSMAEIALELRISESAVKKRLFDAKNALKEDLLPFQQEM